MRQVMMLRGGGGAARWEIARRQSLKVYRPTCVPLWPAITDNKWVLARRSAGTNSGSASVGPASGRQWTAQYWCYHTKQHWLGIDERQLGGGWGSWGSPTPTSLIHRLMASRVRRQRAVRHGARSHETITLGGCLDLMALIASLGLAATWLSFPRRWQLRID